MCLNIGPAPLVQALCPTLPAANDLQLLDAEGLQGDGAFRLGLELRQPARLARRTIPPPQTSIMSPHFITRDLTRTCKLSTLTFEPQLSHEDTLRLPGDDSCSWDPRGSFCQVSPYLSSKLIAFLMGSAFQGCLLIRIDNICCSVPPAPLPQLTRLVFNCGLTLDINPCNLLQRSEILLFYSVRGIKSPHSF